MPRLAERGRQFILFLGDIAVLVASLFIALTVRSSFKIARFTFSQHLTPFAIIFALWMIIFYVGGLYAIRRAKNDWQFFQLFLSLLGSNALVAILFFYFVPFFAITPKTILFLALFIAGVLLVLWRIVFNSVVPLQPFRIGIIGSGSDIEELVHDMEANPQRGYACVVWHKEYSPARAAEFHHKHIDLLVIDFRNIAQNLIGEFLQPSPHPFQVMDFVDFYESRMQRIPLSAIDNRWFILNIHSHRSVFSSFVKRMMDVILSVLLALIGIVCAPFVAIAIYLETGSPVLFRQGRVGRLQHPFTIYKFRSMHGNKVTRVGRFIRTTHLDEIPQLWNVLRGDMSFVGPRPEQVVIVESLNKEVPFYKERLWVRPGITGWAQLHEPTAQAEDAQRKLQYDLYYLKHRSFFLDMEIIVKTLRIVVL